MIRNRKSVKFVVSLCLVFFVCSISFSRAALNEDGDWQFWTYDSATMKLADKVMLAFDGMLRYGDDMSYLWYWHADAGLVFKVHKHVALKPSFRYKACRTGPRVTPAGTNLRAWRYVKNPSMNVIIAGNIGEWKIKNVCRFSMWDFDDDFQELAGMKVNTDRLFYRNITAVMPPCAFTDLKLKPFLKEDFFYDTDENEINRNRLSAGLVMVKHETVKPSIYYMLESTDWLTGGTRNINILGVDLAFSF